MLTKHSQSARGRMAFTWKRIAHGTLCVKYEPDLTKGRETCSGQEISDGQTDERKRGQID
uniref:Uncharacterized protein n=1 Tax=Magallana gigas TaxID=29159 RepID=K1QCB7_MAGGI